MRGLLRKCGAVNDPRTTAAALAFPVVDDCLQIGGVALTELVKRVGRTPFYAYDQRLVAERIHALKQALPADIHLHYAIKANPMPALVRAIVPQVDGLDVASAGALRGALAAGMRAT